MSQRALGRRRGPSPAERPWAAKSPSDCPLHYRHTGASSSDALSLSDASRTDSAPAALARGAPGGTSPRAEEPGAARAERAGSPRSSSQCSRSSAPSWAPSGERLRRPSSRARRRGLSRTEFNGHAMSAIHAVATRMTAGQRLSAACATIDTIPEQLDGLLQHKVDNLAMNVETKLTAVRRMIHRSGATGTACTEEALQMLKEIPDIILSSFEEKIVKVRNTVRQRVNGMIHELKKDEQIAEDQISRIFWTIPEDVQQIAGAAVEEAVQQSQEQAARQLNNALQNLPEDALENCRVISNVKQEIIKEVPGVYPETVRAARTTAAVSVGHAILAVDTEAGGVPNKVVVDVLFRAKTGGMDGLPAGLAPTRAASNTGSKASRASSRCSRSSTSGAPSAAPRAGDSAAPASRPEAGPGRPGAALGGAPAGPAAPGCGADCGAGPGGNPGSMGHPELCSRPCLYFRQSQCRNGAVCGFCHCPHPRRPAHLGRRHRRVLGGLALRDRLAVSSPVLEAKLQLLGIPADVLSLPRPVNYEDPEALHDFVADEGLGGERRRQHRLKDARCMQMQRALRALTLRSLLTVLLNPPDSSHPHATFETVVEKLRSKIQAAK